MVRFEKDKLVIEIAVTSRFRAAEKCIELQIALLNLLGTVTQETIDEEYFIEIPMLIKALIPDLEDVKT